MHTVINRMTEAVKQWSLTCTLAVYGMWNTVPINYYQVSTCSMQCGNGTINLKTVCTVKWSLAQSVQVRINVYSRIPVYSFRDVRSAHEEELMQHVIQAIVLCIYIPVWCVCVCWPWCTVVFMIFCPSCALYVHPNEMHVILVVYLVKFAISYMWEPATDFYISFCTIFDIYFTSSWYHMVDCRNC